MNESLGQNDVRRPQSGSVGFSQQEGRSYSSHNEQKTCDVYSPREEANPRDRNLSREKSYPPNVSAGYARSHECRSPSMNPVSGHRASEQTAEDMSKTQSSISREMPRDKSRLWDEYLRKNTEETGYSSHSTHNSQVRPREVSSLRERDNSHRPRPVNSNPPDPNAGQSRFHRHTSPSRKFDEAQKSDRTRTEHHNKHPEWDQMAGNMSKTQSSGSLGWPPAKPPLWEEMLRKRREEEAKVAQRSQRTTKDYAVERYKANKGDSKPSEYSGDSVDENEGKRF